MYEGLLIIHLQLVGAHLAGRALHFAKKYCCNFSKFSCSQLCSSHFGKKPTKNIISPQNVITCKNIYCTSSDFQVILVALWSTVTFVLFLPPLLMNIFHHRPSSARFCSQESELWISVFLCGFNLVHRWWLGGSFQWSFLVPLIGGR